jgi:hypothetical protein
MTQSTSNGPSLEEPQTFTESAADLHEGNFSAIAARYKASGVKAPGEILMSFSKSFKAEIPPAAETPKPGLGHAKLFGGQANAKLRH